MQNYASSMPVNISCVPTRVPPGIGNASSATITPGQASTVAPGPPLQQSLSVVGAMPQVQVGRTYQPQVFSQPLVAPTGLAMHNPPRRQGTTGLDPQPSSSSAQQIVERRPSNQPYVRVPSLERTPVYPQVSLLEQRSSFTPPTQARILERKPSNPIVQPVVTNPQSQVGMSMGVSTPKMMARVLPGAGASLTPPRMRVSGGTQPLMMASLTMPQCQGPTITTAPQMSMLMAQNLNPQLCVQQAPRSMEQTPMQAGFQPVTQIPKWSGFSGSVLQPRA